MHAIVRPGRIDILGANGFVKESWEPLLDDLKAVHVASFNPPGKRMTPAIGPTGRVDAIIYRIAVMEDDQVIRILGKYGIEASADGELAQGATGGTS